MIEAQTKCYLVEVDEGVPQRVLGQDAWVADDDAAKASPGESHVEAPGVGEESNALVFVGSSRGGRGGRRTGEV